MGKLKLYIIIGVVAIAFMVTLYLLIGEDDDGDEEEAKASIQAAATALGLDPAILVADAFDIYNAFNFGTWLTQGFTEDEPEIIRVIQKYDRSTFPLLVKAYNTRYKRKLKDDLREHLNEEELFEISHVQI